MTTKADEHLFEYTRARFLIDEPKQMARRRIRCNIKELGRAAAKAVGATRCVNIERCPDGMYNKAYVLSMDNGMQVIGKVPNFNAGIPHYSSKLLKTPAPRVYTWNSRVDDVNTVGAEYIMMEKLSGVPLANIWWRLKPDVKLKIFMLVFKFQKRWTAVQFSQYGSLYYSKDIVTKFNSLLYIENGAPITNNRFAVGPAAGRDWHEEGRNSIQCYRGPFIVYGPDPLYEPTITKKPASLEYYIQSLGSLDWQSIQVAPLFEHNLDPSFLDYHGPDIGDSLDIPKLPDNFDSLQGEEKTLTLNRFMDKSVMVACRRLVQGKNPQQYNAIRFQSSIPGHILSLSRRIFELGEAHLGALLLDLRDEWHNHFPDKHAPPFPTNFSEKQVADLEADTKRADLSI
ncbi:hypothetical protein AJ79_02115 [Helicocarpus griseus UAMH5409]|uniref:Altered inheritance of mitochondria protein 9, mitochondrial n=1 Tax=Helicocarpus griseus UAMH5409 TaxID=1447875 RepID=A0A2B7Y4Y4_9EURO|nr:hypothetical protein AJ79_02115 [Helicocarpus griseus UAMH5409]